MQSLHIISFIRASRIRKDGKTPIFMRVTVDGKRVEFTTGAAIEPDKWDAEKQEAKGRGVDAQRINSTINSIESKVTQIYNSLAIKGKVDPERLKSLLHGEEDKTEVPLLDMYEQHNQEFEEKVKAGRRSDSTLKKYKTIKSHVTDFIAGKNVKASDVDPVFVDDLHHYLSTKKGINNDTTVRYIRLFGVVMRWGKKRGYTNIDVVEDYEGKKEKKPPVNLSTEELKAIMNLDITDDGMNRVRDIFVFSCLTSLAYADIKKLTTDEIVEHKGRKWIVTRRQKTKEMSQLPMLPEAVKIYEKYADYREITDDNTVLPVPSNQQCNRLLKGIIVAAGIKKNITFHKGRHTFGRLMAKKNVPIAKTATMMGHTNLRMTQLYYDVTPDSLADEMDRLDGKLFED